MRICSMSAALAACAIVSAAGAGVVYDETIDGDLSDDRFNPTDIATALGSNRARMSVVDSNSPGGDRDYFTVSIGAGEFIDRIILDESSVGSSGIDNTAFIGLAFDDIFDFDPVNLTGPGLVGFVLTDDTLVGTDILGALSGGLGSLGAGDYTFWVQQTGVDETTVGLDIRVAPAPGAMALLAMGALGGVRRRR